MPLRLKLLVTDAQPKDFVDLVDQQSGNRAVAVISAQEALGIVARDQHRAAMLSARIIEKLWAETSAAKRLHEHK